MSVTIFSSNQVSILSGALDPRTTTGQLSPPVLDTTNKNATSLNADENPSKNSPTNTPILASGNGATSATAIKKSNENISHACDSSSYVGKAVFEVGATAGQLMRSIREAIKLALAALGVNPASSAISSQLKKIGYFVDDIKKFIDDIKNFVEGYVRYLNIIKEFIAYLSSLPARLLQYFADCVQLLQQQLAAGYLTELSKAAGVSFNIENTIREVTNGLGELNTNIVTITATASAAFGASVVGNAISSSNTTIQTEATTAVYEAAGYYDTSQNYGDKP